MSHIFLTGFMGAGKSTVGRLLAERLGRPFVDLDVLIEEREGAPVRELFRERGEEGFRRGEHDALAALGASPDAVVATGGGVILREDNRVTMKQLGKVVYLAVTPEEAIARVGDGADRPLLAGVDLPAVRAILDARLSLYAATADSVVDTVGRSADAVTTDVLSVLSGTPSCSRVDAGDGEGYRIVVSPGVLGSLGRYVREVVDTAHVVLVSDETVFELLGDTAVSSLESAGLRTSVCTVTAGESSKSWSRAGSLLEEFSAHGVDRGSCVVALGGGVVGDLAGFCAATYMRGIPVVQVPTTLLAQVDSSIGGKTGVDLVAGKNLAGAFWPPRIVLADPSVLVSLPDAEWTNGLVEAAKAALLEDEDVLERFESRVDGLLARDAETIRETVIEAAAFKAGIVSADLREADVRECLNLGHTLGHALEVTAGYDALPHGLAVAEGIRFSALLAGEQVGASPGFIGRIEALLDAIGGSRTAFADRVAEELSTLTPEALLHAMKSDKKARSGVVRFVLIERPGLWRVVQISDDRVLAALAIWRTTIEGEV
ncbi:MAG: 3-dehydroquinate synthase [Coriobacteriia bacterium]|nr:3-dehydroquinate synthase [Coriobacteriia bacterium]